MKRLRSTILVFLSLLFGIDTVITHNALAADTIRVGHFPNIIHVQGLVAQHLSRTGHGWFEERLGKDVKIDWYIYNAGPGAWKHSWLIPSISPM